MSVNPAPKKVLSRNIDEDNAKNYDLLVTYASSIPTDRLLTLNTWLKNGEPVGNYSGPKPTYNLVIDWKECEEDEYVEMINRAMERCFGMRAAAGWQLFIRGDQLNLLIGTFRKEYLRLRSMEHPQLLILDIWVDNLLQEMKRIHALPAAHSSLDAEVQPRPPAVESQQRRSSRSPMPELHNKSYPCTIPPKIIGQPPAPNKATVRSRPSLSPSAPASTSTPKQTTSARTAATADRTAAKSNEASKRPSTTIASFSTSVPSKQRPRSGSSSPGSAPTRPRPVSRRPIPEPIGDSTTALTVANLLTVPGHEPGRAPNKSSWPLASQSDYESDEEARQLRQDIVDLERSDIDDNGHHITDLMSDNDNSDYGGGSNGATQEGGVAQELDDEEEDEEDENNMDDDDDEEDEDDYVPVREKSRSSRRVVDLSADEEEDPIIQEPQQGPLRTRKEQARLAKLAKDSFQHQGKSKTPTSRYIQVPTQPSGSKRKSSSIQQSQSKRPRLPEASASGVHTPETNRRSPETLRGTQTEAPTDVDTPTPSLKKKGKESEIWKYYILIATDGKNKHMECRACEKPVKGQGTSNFHGHQRECPKLRDAFNAGIPGICCKIPPATQSTMEPPTGKLRLPFKQEKFQAAVMKWIIVSGLPFTTIQNPHLLQAFQTANPDTRLQSARTLARKLEDTWDVVNERVLDEIKNTPATMHYLHDSWTDTGRKNSYFGIYVSYVDDNWEYKEVLLRLVHMKGSHSGRRMGDGLFNLFTHVGIVQMLGPGTADNASNNRTAADRVAERVQAELELEAKGKEMVGCLCHIANIAALEYLSHESTRTAEDYRYAAENIPDIKVLGENRFWNPDLEDAIEQDDDVLADQNIEGEDQEQEEDEWETEEEEEDDDEVAKSPLDKVHQLAVYVHGSPQRRADFEKARLSRDPDTPKGLLPLKDVKTRWNSKEAATARVIRLRKTISYYTTRENSPKCPKFTKNDFDALEIIQPSLKIFLNLTQIYSEVGANSYRIIPDLINAIEELEELHSHPSVSSNRFASCKQAVDKLKKYLHKFLRNRWVLAALALDPTVREEGLKRLLTVDFKAKEYFISTVAFIKQRVAHYQEHIAAQMGSDDVIEEVKSKRPARVNKFASTKYQTGHQEITHNMNDPWECYNSDMIRFATIKDEPVLAYWKRMSAQKEMRALAWTARDLLGLASSSTSVERLFSHAGHVLGKRRGSLSARLLAKQTMLRMWEMMGFLTADDLVVSNSKK